MNCKNINQNYEHITGYIERCIIAIRSTIILRCSNIRRKFTNYAAEKRWNSTATLSTGSTIDDWRTERRIKKFFKTFLNNVKLISQTSFCSEHFGHWVGWISSIIWQNFNNVRAPSGLPLEKCTENDKLGTSLIFNRKWRLNFSWWFCETSCW